MSLNRTARPNRAAMHAAMNELFMRIALFLVFSTFAVAPRLASAATTNLESLAFGGQSMGTTSHALALTFTNDGTTAILGQVLARRRRRGSSIDLGTVVVVLAQDAQRVSDD